MDSWTDWARRTFADADLGDVRRSRRLVRIAAEAGRHPAGRISQVFERDADRQGAYDFIESEHVSSAAIRKAIVNATARACAQEDWVYIPLDGTSIKLWDGTQRKDFGAIGTYRSKATGLKLYNAIALSPAGAPIGVASQVWWSRPRQRIERKHHRGRKAEEKETGFLLESIDQTRQAFAKHAPSTVCWFQLDRGGDSQLVLQHLDECGHWYTVRSCSNRRLVSSDENPRYLRETLAKRPVLGTLRVQLSARPDRPARQAKLSIRATEVTLTLTDRWARQYTTLTLTAVSVRERRRTRGVEWTLLTNRVVEDIEDAVQIVEGYVQRWRVEEFHKTWKTGTCNVEQTQLHRSERVIKWATILSAVAARVERLKRLSRAEPKALASVELNRDEIEALIHLRSREKSFKRTAPDKLTLGEATLWIAQLGGYTGRSSGGPPGTITISRGLQRLQPAADLMGVLREKR